MNSYERKALNRANESKAKWKTKAIERNKTVHASKVRIRDLEKSRKMWRERYFAEKEKSTQNSLSTPASPPIATPCDSKFIQLVIISVCINLTLNCAVSFRAVPKILAVFKRLLQAFGLQFNCKIPHFTTVIRWTLRVGIFLLTKAVKQRLSQWICVMDHTIQVGTKKAFVVLKIPVEAMKRLGALTLKDVEVLSIKVQEKWNGTIVQNLLEQLFSTVGFPVQVVIDGGSDLNKGIRNILKTLEFPFKVTSDITHLIARLLKRKYHQHPLFNTMMSKLSKTKSHILQTSYAYLTPLKERSKARFLNLPSIAKWTKQIIDYMNSLPNSSEEDREKKEKLMSTFSWIFEYQDFLTDFWTEIQVLTDVQKIVKNTGLHELSYKKVRTLLHTLPNDDLKEPLLDYFHTEFEFASHVSYPILLTSDMIESLFGKYKYLAKPHCMSEINRMIFALPCITEEISPELVKEAFCGITNKEAEQLCRQEISETLLSKRRKAFASVRSEKITDTDIIHFSNKDTLSDSVATEYRGQKTAETLSVLTG